MTTKTHYETLGIADTATAEEIRSAYRRRARATHPDMGGSPEEFDAVQKAWEALQDEGDRAAYDRSLHQPEPQAAQPQPAASADTAAFFDGTDYVQDISEPQMSRGVYTPAPPVDIRLVPDALLPFSTALGLTPWGAVENRRANVLHRAGMESAYINAYIRSDVRWVKASTITFGVLWLFYLLFILAANPGPVSATLNWAAVMPLGIGGTIAACLAAVIAPYGLLPFLWGDRLTTHLTRKGASHA